MLKIYSEYYEKGIVVDSETRKILFDVYKQIAKDQGFSTDIDCPEDIDCSSVYDHVAYHVESFGAPYEGYSSVAHLFKSVPKCYTPNDGVYPLCKGNKEALHECKHCCLYEDMDEQYDNK